MINPGLLELLACPRCKGPLERADTLNCGICSLRFPVVEGVPLMLDEESSIFDIESCINGDGPGHGSGDSGVKKIVRRLIPSITLNIGSSENYHEFVSLLRECSNKEFKPQVLVIGGAVEGRGFDEGELWKGVDLYETDVALGPRTQLICDGHDLPFLDKTFDGVIIQAVLEHVLDPAKCVNEIERVLKDDGYVYAETPFMQQVHLGRLDFTRFTFLGHRRLFRRFEEIAAESVCGAGTALAWSYCYFLMSFFSSRRWQRAAFGLGSLTSFFLKYFDYLFKGKPGAFDASSAYFFLGRKSAGTISDRELVAGYRGMFK